MRTRSHRLYIVIHIFVDTSQPVAVMSNLQLHERERASERHSSVRPSHPIPARPECIPSPASGTLAAERRQCSLSPARYKARTPIHAYLRRTHARPTAQTRTASLQAHAIQAQPVQAPRPLHHAQFVEALLAGRRPPPDVPLLARAHGVSEAFARAVAASAAALEAWAADW